MEALKKYALERVVRPLILYNGLGRVVTVDFESFEDDPTQVVIHVDRPGAREHTLPAARSLVYDFVFPVTEEHRQRGLKVQLKVSVVAHVTVGVAPRSGPCSVYYLYLADNREEARARVFRVLPDEPLAVINLCAGPPTVPNSALLNQQGQSVRYTAPFTVSPDILQTFLVF